MLGASGAGSVGAVGPFDGRGGSRLLFGGFCAEISRLLAMAKAPKRGAASLVDPSLALTLGRLSAPDHRTQPCGSCPRERNGFRVCFYVRGWLKKTTGHPHAIVATSTKHKTILPEEPARRVEVLEARQRIEREDDERELDERRERRPGPQDRVRHHCDQPVRPRAS